MELFEFAETFDSLVFYADYEKKYLWAYLLCGALCYLVLYVFKTIALFTVARHGGYKHKWMAFIPFFNTYYIGVVSDKNRLFGMRATSFSLAAAISEFVCVSLYVLYYVAECLLFYGKYVTPVFTPQVYGSIQFNVLTGYAASNDLPAGLEWAWWVFSYLQTYVIYWVNLINVLFELFTMVMFFRTYAPRTYVAYFILSTIFPIGAIFMFAVRNKPARSYSDYIREQQQRRFTYYRDHVNHNGYGGYGGYGGYNGGSYDKAPPPDPFGGAGETQQNSDKKETPPDDPFSDF